MPTVAEQLCKMKIISKTKRSGTRILKKVWSACAPQHSLTRSEVVGLRRSERHGKSPSAWHTKEAGR